MRATRCPSCGSRRVSRTGHCARCGSQQFGILVPPPCWAAVASVLLCLLACLTACAGLFGLTWTLLTPAVRGPSLGGALSQGAEMLVLLVATTLAVSAAHRATILAVPRSA